MKVSELIKRLEDMPPDAEVFGIYDGATRLEVSTLWLARSGTVVVADYGAVVYYDEDRRARTIQSEPGA